MFGIRGLARILLAGIFLFGGTSAWKRAPQLAAKAEPLEDPIQKATGVPLTSVELVRINSGVQIAAGGLFAIGFQQRLMALTLAATLVPTTLIGHRFWEADDEAEIAQQKIHFIKNAGLLGGLVFAALDTGGRPSVFWSGKRAARSLRDTVASTTSSVIDTVDR